MSCASRLGFWRADRLFLLILAVATLLGLIYNAVILPGFGPDEPRHIAYTQMLWREHRLPSMDANDVEYGGAHAYHPPLYYLFELPLALLGTLLPANGSTHLLRLGSLALCFLTLLLVYDVAWLAGKGDRTVARLATAQLAFLPIFGMTSGIVNNDGATILASVGFLWLLGRFWNARDVRSALWLGLAFGLGALCKGSILLADGAALLTYFWVQGRRLGWNQARVVLRFALVLIVTVAIAGAWYGRNKLLYGQLQPIPVGYTVAALPRPENGILVMMMHPNFPALFGVANWGIFYTLWSQKDWIPESFRTPIYSVLLLYCVVGCLGLLIRKKPSLPSLEPKSEATDEIAALQSEVVIKSGAIAFAFTWLSCLFIALFVHWGQAEGGRYLLPTFVGWSVLLALGWRSLVGAKVLKAVFWVVSLAFLALNGLAIYWLLAYLNPTFGPK